MNTDKTMLALGTMALGLMSWGAQADPAYRIVGTSQMKCYDNRSEIAPPKQGQPFYGQDAQHPGRAPSYKLSVDGLTVYDNVTGLTWQHSPAVGQASSLSSGSAAVGKLEAYPTHNDKLTFAQAQEQQAKLNAAKFGGFTDWRLPSIKGLYSLILFSGTDVSPCMDSQPCPVGSSAATPS